MFEVPNVQRHKWKSITARNAQHHPKIIHFLDDVVEICQQVINLWHRIGLSQKKKQ